MEFGTRRVDHFGKSATTWAPPPPRISGIIELGENLQKIYGAQSVAGKILSRNGLGANPSAYNQFAIYR
jgi:hypothetical protein